MNKKATIYCVNFLLVLSTCIAYGQKKKKERPVVNLGIVIDGPWHSNEPIRELFEQEILTLTRDEFDVRFPENKRIVADHAAAGVRNALDRLLADPEVSLVLALGPIASNEACHRGALPKPVVAPFIINAAAQNLLRKDGATGVKNLSCITYPSDISRDIEVFRELAPFTKITVLLSSAVHEAIPQLAGAVASGPCAGRSQRVPQRASRQNFRAPPKDQLAMDTLKSRAGANARVHRLFRPLRCLSLGK